MKKKVFITRNSGAIYFSVKISTRMTNWIEEEKPAKLYEKEIVKRIKKQGCKGKHKMTKIWMKTHSSLVIIRSWNDFIKDFKIRFCAVVQINHLCNVETHIFLNPS